MPQLQHPSDFLLFLDELNVSRPHLPPALQDREAPKRPRAQWLQVFMDPLPAEPGSDELKSFLDTFGAVEDVSAPKTGGFSMDFQALGGLKSL